MTDFATRPEISGTFGMATSTHWIASATGFGILERGGNAFDAAVAMGLTLQIIEPQLSGPAGEVPVIFQRLGEPVRVLCGQGVAPAIALARHGHPLLPRVAETIAGLADFFRDHWPTSAVGR